jgi:succinate dehydrogenase/fumarate reductase flavoprotein subunit
MEELASPGDVAPLQVDLSAIARFDVEVDVVVVGSGYAGSVAAIEAHDKGARVLLAEKMQDPGGISVLAGGAWRFAYNAEDLRLSESDE